MADDVPGPEDVDDATEIGTQPLFAQTSSQLESVRSLGHLNRETQIKNKYATATPRFIKKRFTIMNKLVTEMTDF